MSENLYPLTPGKHSEALDRAHRLRVQKILDANPDLKLPAEILEAWMTPLRQAVGSCFATAPAIRIQQEEPMQFLQDLVELVETQKLKRTFDGIEYAVPICPVDQPLLRLWEYTLASFTETHSKRLLKSLEPMVRRIAPADEKIFLYLWGKRLPDYFQEIYDPEMPQIEHVGRYEDRPAGFRLLYKHGRSLPSMWTFIYTAEEYVDALTDFFRSTEASVIEELEDEEYSQVVDEIINYLRMPQFLEESEPWAYVSGGSMATLLRVYYGRKPSFRESRVETPLDLLRFLLEVKEEHEGTLLMESPHHAFLFKPSWLFDVNIEEQRAFWQNAPPLSPKELFTSWPFVEWNDLRPTLTKIFEYLEISPVMEGIPMQERFTVREVQYLCQMLLMRHLGRSDDREDWPYRIRHAMRALGLAAPAPILFADTNWNWDFFAFVVSPTSGELELWCSDYIGIEAAPFSEWSNWISDTWRVYLPFT